MTRINLIRAETVVASCAVGRAQVRAFVLAAAALAVVHVALDWRLTGLVEKRDALRLELAQRDSAALRKATSTTTEPRADASLRPREVGVRLRTIATSIPRDLWLVFYGERQSEVTMYGMASDETAPRLFVEKLDATSAFADVEITETSRRSSADRPAGEDGSYEFRASAIRSNAAVTIDTGPPTP